MKRSSGDPYGAILDSLCLIFRKYGEESWELEFSRCRNEWKSINATGRYQEIRHSGMGGLDDLIICTENGHRITKEQEPWVNELIQFLGELGLRLAATHGDPESLPADNPDADPGKNSLSGWRCLSCGYGEVSPTDIRFYLAKTVFSDLTLEALRQGRLVDYVRGTLEGESREHVDQIERIAAIALHSGIPVRERTGWMRPCPQCTSNDTAVYRWVEMAGNPPSFRPASDNLRLKG
jgi:hypothetical protein